MPNSRIRRALGAATASWHLAYGNLPRLERPVNDRADGLRSDPMDMTCQDGYTSGIVCNLLVDNDNIVYTTHDGLGAHRGVEAYNVLGDPAVRGGDSGGLVFALTGGTRQARGIVSAGGDELGSGNRYILWTEAPFIFSTFGMTLA